MVVVPIQTSMTVPSCLTHCVSISPGRCNAPVPARKAVRPAGVSRSVYGRPSSSSRG